MGLKVFNPDASNQLDPENMTMRQLFETHLQPELTERAAKTIGEYHTLLSDWERLTDNAPMRKLSRLALITFRNNLVRELDPKRGKRRTAGTVNKKLRTMGPLVKLAWPADSHNPSGLGLCGYFKLLEPLAEEKTLPFIFSRKQVSRLYNLARETTWPRSWGPLSWQTIFVLHYSCGPRTFDLLSLTWSDVDFQFRRGMGSITFQANKTGKLQRIPLNPSARFHLEQLRKVSSSPLVFPKFQKSNYTTIRRHWARLVKLADLPEGTVMESFRKTCNTAYNDRWNGVGDWILGHSLAGVNAKNYYNPTRKVLHAVQRLPLPKAFRA